MYPTSEQCRTQQARHEAVLATSDVTDVRRRATAAARAWSQEALRADQREAPFQGYLWRLTADHQMTSADLNCLTSENPDRDLAET
jgi:hypothetical protein